MPCVRQLNVEFMVDRRSTLPARRTRLIGRGLELDVLRDRVLHGDRRLTTLTGAAGTGKTTLALEVARRVEAVVPDGAWFVDLTVVLEADVNAIVFAWAGALGIVDDGRDQRDALTDHLAARQILVVLDNCEHLLPALAEVVDTLLDRCPDLRILATSRAALRIRGESVYLVPPFPIPDSMGADSADLLRVDAVQLFVERAASADPAFELTPLTGPAVASICQRLEGIPLAIELAAAMASAFTAVEIDERLAAVGGLVATGDPSGRQRTMESALDWSHELLDPAAQVLFRRLSVFAGGWSLEAAEQVGSIGGEPEGVAPLLARLVDHSLVVRDGEGTRSRYRMLAPIAEYAARRLAASPDPAAASLAHATYFLGWSARRSDDAGECLPEDVDRLAAEHENCLAAIRWAERAGAMPLRLGLIMHLVVLWRVRGHLHLAVRLLEALLVDLAEPTQERALVLGVLAEFGTVLGEYATAAARAREAEVLFVDAGDAIGARTMIAIRGSIAAGRGDLAGALAEYEGAKPRVDEHPSDVVLAFWHAGIGRILLGSGDLDAAQHHLQLACDRFERQPSWYRGRVLAMLGTIARRNGDLDRAGGLFAEALDSLCRYGATVEAIASLDGMARLAIDRHELARAARLFAAATGMRDATGAASPAAADAARRNADIDEIRSRLTPRQFEDAWSLGLGMSLDQATSFATAAPEAVTTTPARGSALTPREREIAELVALGLTNREIAERLVIAPGTVKIHVERILGKLGRTSRVQIATWALEERSPSSP